MDVFECAQLYGSLLKQVWELQPLELLGQGLAVPDLSVPISLVRPTISYVQIGVVLFLF
jgi:hypothetical protein